MRARLLFYCSLVSILRLFIFFLLSPAPLTSPASGAQAGAEYNPQWTKLPSLALSNQAGKGWVKTDSRVGR